MYHRLYTKPGSPLKQPALFLNPEKMIRIPLLLHSDLPIWALCLQMDQISGPLSVVESKTRKQLWFLPFISTLFIFINSKK